MSGEIIVPKIGLTVESVEVVAWRKDIGQAVAAGEVVVELAADKADLEVEAPAGGTLTEILVEVGQMAALGEVLGRIGDGSSTIESEIPAGAAVVTAPDAELAKARHADARRGPEWRNPRSDLAVTSSGSTLDTSRLRVSPLARRAAQEAGLHLPSLVGSGPRGRIVMRDVRAALDGAPRASAALDAARAASAAPDSQPTTAPALVDGDLQEVRFKAARLATARLMARSRDEAAPVTLHTRAPAELARMTIQRLKAEGLPATFNHAVLWSVARALQEHPMLNAAWSGEQLFMSRRIHLGIAVDDDGDLLTGVLADAAGLDVLQTVLGAVEAVARARSRAIPPVSPTFTVSNLGMFGVEQFTPIIVPPQIAILGVGAIVDGRCHLSLTFDHRAVDGAPAARFLAAVKDELATFDGR